jgi:hypothetical protein
MQSRSAAYVQKRLAYEAIWKELLDTFNRRVDAFLISAW